MNKKSLLSGQHFFVFILTWFGLLQFAFGEGSFDTLLVQKIETFKQKYPAEVVFLHINGQPVYHISYFQVY